MNITFPEYTGTRVLMMPFIQGDINSLPEPIRSTYGDVLSNMHLQKGEIGYVTIDESVVAKGKAQRAYEAANGRSVHTEATRNNEMLCWGGLGWGRIAGVTLEPDTQVLVASNMSDTTAYWDNEVPVHNVTKDGTLSDIENYPMSTAMTLKAGEVVKMSVLTPHESLPVREDGKRQFIRVVGKGIKGMLPNYTQNPLMQ